jgi:hypothetical protein
MTMTARVATERERARRPGVRAHPSSDGPLSAGVLALQRSFGNRAVTVLVQRTCSGGGCCAACQERTDEVAPQGSDPAEQTNNEAFAGR